MKDPTNIQHAPEDATHWAPETDHWMECYYRFENGLWYMVNAYWASDVTERPYGRPAKAWKEDGKVELIRSITDLVPMDETSSA